MTIVGALVGTCGIDGWCTKQPRMVIKKKDYGKFIIEHSKKGGISF